MAMSVPIAVRSSSGIILNNGLPDCTNLEAYPPVESKACRTIVFSPDGQYFAYINGGTLKIVRTDSWKDVAIIQGTKAYYLSFSPKSTYLMTWEPFVVNSANPQGSPNLNIYKSEDGSLVKNFVHKKQGNWEPIWSVDEHLFSRMVNTDVVFYEGCNFERIVTRINCHKVASYSISPTVGTQFVLCHTPGSNGQPSFGRLFKYPNFEAQQAIANKSFFQADKVSFYWNCKGTHALLLTTMEVDKTGSSYYGKQGLCFVNTKGETMMIQPGKEGPIYSVAWSPKGTEFCLIYGFTPAKATLYNLKGDPVFEMGSGARNSIYYNPHGNILLLGGFGNLRGQVELWDATQKKLIGKMEAPDSTLLEWSPDGKHFLTATTAPRLRIGNGFKIWHYTGVLLYEKLWNKDEELYDVIWKKCPQNTFKEPVINAGEKVKGIEASQPQASKQAYRPPSARNKNITFKLHDDDDVVVTPGTNPNPSKASLKQRKKRDAKKAKKAEEGGDNNKVEEKEKSTAVVSNVQVTLTGDLEKDKKIKNIKKKLDAIEKLKDQQAQGKPLEINQLAKINTEAELLNELKQLQI